MDAGKRINFPIFAVGIILQNKLQLPGTGVP